MMEQAVASDDNRSRKLLALQNHPCEAPTGKYLPTAESQNRLCLLSPSMMQSTARFIAFRDGTLRAMIAEDPDDLYLRDLMTCIEDVLAWRATIPEQDRFWKKD